MIVFILLKVDVTLGGGCGIGEDWHSFREVKFLQGWSKTLWFRFLMLLKEMGARGSERDFILLFWCKSGELGSKGSPRFLCVTLVVGSFSLDFLRAVISY